MRAVLKDKQCPLAQMAPMPSSLRKGLWENIWGVGLSPAPGQVKGEAGRCLKIMQHNRITGFWNSQALLNQPLASGPSREGLTEGQVGEVLASTESKKDYS